MRSNEETRPESDPPPEVAVSAPDVEEEIEWGTPPFQPLRALSALALTAVGFGIYELVLLNFWSSESLGVHQHIPWPSYLLMALALVVTLAAVRLALSIWSPHAKMGFSLLAIFAAAAVGIGGGRFVSYTMRGTLNPTYRLALAPGDEFPPFTLADQKGVMHDGAGAPGSKATLVYIYRGDYDAFARHEIADLNAIRPELRKSGADVIAISTDPIDRSKMRSSYLHSDVPLLSDTQETVVGPLGLVQKHRDGEPDNAIPAFFVLDSTGKIRWVFASPYYRELPPPEELIAAVRSVTDSPPH
jgi:peroxiredoxin